MRDRSFWTERGSSVNGRGTVLVEFDRPCKACGKLFSIFVTMRIASGEADTNNFGLANCQRHRRKNNLKKVQRGA